MSIVDSIVDYNINRVEDYIPYYPYISNPSFNSLIYSKKEFKYPIVSGNVLPYQKFVSTFLSTRTPYQSLLVFHEMGTGKTCTAVKTVEQIISENGPIKRALVLLKGQSLIDNFIYELVNVCAPEKYGYLKKDERVKSKLRSKYEFWTYETFAKNITPSQYSAYSDHVIIIDEVHNIVTKSMEEYTPIHSFLHNVQRCKILLMSGTPMRDLANEIAYVMNLILPLDKQIPTGTEFNSLFINKDTLKNTETLKQYFKGYVSYVKSSISNVVKRYVGQKIGLLNHFTVFPTYMDNFQSNVYYKTISNEQDLYSASRQVSLFVFPDGSYGSKGFNKYFSRIEKKNRLGENKNSYVLKLPINLDELENLSTKYYYILNSLRNNENKLFFIYCEFVEGSGLIILSKLLELIGYSKATGKETSEGKRYAIITNMTTTLKQTRKVLALYNDSKNSTGKYIHVILGSRMISEGFTLKNVQEVHILTPHWNYGETDQAIARAYRAFSHNTLISQGITPVVNVYQHVSLPEDQSVKSIDLTMYEVSEKKDLIIKQVERLIKEEAVDCRTMYRHNMINGRDYERSCDYMKCEYTCDSIVLPEDDTTYNLYYNSEDIARLVLNIQETCPKSTIDVSSISPLTVIGATSQVYKVTGKYGNTGYLHVHDSTIYASPSVYGSEDTDDSYYFINPVLQSTNMFDKVSERYTYTKRIPLLIDDFCNTLSTDILKEFPTRVSESFIEYSFFPSTRPQIKDTVQSYYKKYITQTQDTTVSTLPFSETGKMRCLENNVWVDCPSSIVTSVQSGNKNIEVRAKEYGLFGVVDKSKFIIKKLTEENVKDRRLAPRGRVCSTIDKSELEDICKKLDIVVQPFYSKKEICKLIREWMDVHDLVIYM